MAALGMQKAAKLMHEVTWWLFDSAGDFGWESGSLNRGRAGVEVIRQKTGGLWDSTVSLMYSPTFEPMGRPSLAMGLDAEILAVEDPDLG
jgi:hypothetical protein